MLKKLLPVLILTALLVSCDKSKFKTKPSLSLKSQSSVVPAEGEAIFSIKLKFTDKEGDLSGGGDSSLFYQPIATNVRKLEGGNIYTKSYVPLPDYPDKNTGEIEIRLVQSFYYRQVLTSVPEADKNDTLLFKIVVKDRAGNLSDTLTTGPIVLLGQ